MIGHRSARLLTVVAAAAALTVACSSSSSDSSSSAESVPADTASSAAAEGSAVAEGSPAAAGPLSVAGVYENTQDAFWGTFLCGAQKRAADLGVTFTPFTNATADNTKMATLLDSALLTDPDAVIFNPIDTTPWETKLKAVMDDGVPVISSQPEPTTTLGYVTSSNDGTPYIQQFVDAIGTDTTGKAVILNGMADAQWQHDRLDKIAEAIKTGVPGLEWLPNQVDGFDVNKGTQIISGLITANPDLKVILAVAGPEGQAVAAAVKQNGKEDDIHVIAYDAVPAEVDGLRDGSVDFLVAQPAYSMGEEQMQAVVDYLNANPGSSGAVPAGGLGSKVMDMGLLTPENVDSPESKAFIYSSTC